LADDEKSVREAWSEGGGLLYKLPKDGTWAKYSCSLTLSKPKHDRGGFPPASAFPMTCKGWIRMACIGTVTESDERSRWIEVAYQFDGSVPVGSYVYKLLLPEKSLMKGQTPGEHALRVWELWGRSKSEKARQIEKLPHIGQSLMPLILAGPLKEVKQVGKVDVESRLGRRSCDEESGRLEVPYPLNPAMPFTVHHHLHSDAPFGVVTTQWTQEYQSESGPLMSLELELIDYGEDATSEIPDAQYAPTSGCGDRPAPCDVIRTPRRSIKPSGFRIDPPTR
jgi:hypothetical protein